MTAHASDAAGNVGVSNLVHPTLTGVTHYDITSEADFNTALKTVNRNGYANTNYLFDLKNSFGLNTDLIDVELNSGS